MKKFDLIFEKAMDWLNEKEYIDSTFEDNIRLLVKALKDNDYIGAAKDVEATVKNVISQPDNVKEIVLDTQEQSLPPIKIQMKQDSDSESFSVTVINVEDPSKQKEFTNSMLETIFDDVLTYIKTSSLEGLKPEAAIDELPPTEGAESQPGAEESALPKA